MKSSQFETGIDPLVIRIADQAEQDITKTERAGYNLAEAVAHVRAGFETRGMPAAAAAAISEYAHHRIRFERAQTALDITLLKSLATKFTTTLGAAVWRDLTP